MRKSLIVVGIVVLCAVSSHAQKITAYGFGNDLTGDSLSAAGIGNHNNQLVPFGSAAFTSAALTPEAAFQYGVSLSQQFSVRAANGQTYNLVYADTVPTGGPGQQPAGSLVIDIYDPNSLVTGGGNDNNFETSVNGVPVAGAMTTGAGANGVGASNGAGGINGVGSAVQTLNVQIIDPLLQKFKSAGAAWQGTIQKAAFNLFWILALINLVITGVWLLLKGGGLLEILAELTRYILFTGFFWWVLQNGAGFANAIINSLVQIGGNAAGNGGFMVPGDVITLSLQVFNQTLQHVNFLQPESILIPVLIALIILILCALIAINMILLLCAAWVVVYAGLIFLGFGGCRWTSDWAIGYWRTIVGIGVSLLTMELIIGIGIQFLKDLITQTAQTLSAGPLAIIMVACIILVVIAHQLPRMVAGMVVGGGHNGAVGGMGVMALIGSAIAAASLAGRVSNAATGAVSNSQRLLSDRIQAAEATMSAGSGRNGSSGSNGASESSAAPRPSGGYSAPVAASSAAPGASSSVYNVSTSGNNKKPATSPASTSKVTDEPALSRPLSPDEQWELENPEFL